MWVCRKAERSALPGYGASELFKSNTAQSSKRRNRFFTSLLEHLHTVSSGFFRFVSAHHQSDLNLVMPPSMFRLPGEKVAEGDLTLEGSLPLGMTETMLNASQASTHQEKCAELPIKLLSDGNVRFLQISGRLGPCS